MPIETIMTQLKNAVERNKASWFSVASVLLAARERKQREQLNAIISHYTLEELEAAEKITQEEISKCIKVIEGHQSVTKPAGGEYTVTFTDPAEAKAKPKRKAKS